MASIVPKKFALPPTANFPTLLRRSRFASFDPTIRQSYGTPPSHLHRGNWGLKRPIAQRKRNAFITLKNFEEHEHYIEWSNAETQIRLIDKIEELKVAPKLVQQTPWFIGLGPAAASDWSKMDSDFAPGESGMPHLPRPAPSPFTPELDGLGLRGKGEYSEKSRMSDDGYLHPNLRAMSPRYFKRYLKKLRSLRPEFQKFLKENGVTTSVRESGLPPDNLHIRFLGQHFDKQFQSPARGKKTGQVSNRTQPTEDETDVHPNQIQPIRQQPHRTGGLMYASPTFLESFFTSGVQPGIVLEEFRASNLDVYYVSTAGIIGKLEKKRAGADVRPVFDANGITHPPAVLLSSQTNSFISVRVTDVHLERPPDAVTAFPSTNSTKDLRIRLDLASHYPSQNDHSRSNTHPPGSMRYNVPTDIPQQKHSSYTFPTRSKMVYTRDPANELHDGTSSSPDEIVNQLTKMTVKDLGVGPDGGMSWNRTRNRNRQGDNQF